MGSHEALCDSQAGAQRLPRLSRNLTPHSFYCVDYRVTHTRALTRSRETGDAN